MLFEFSLHFSSTKKDRLYFHANHLGEAFTLLPAKINDQYLGGAGSLLAVTYMGSPVSRTLWDPEGLARDHKAIEATKAPWWSWANEKD